MRTLLDILTALASLALTGVALAALLIIVVIAAVCLFIARPETRRRPRDAYVDDGAPLLRLGPGGDYVRDVHDIDLTARNGVPATH